MEIKSRLCSTYDQICFNHRQYPPSTMYDFHNSTDIFVNLFFCHFVLERHPELALKTDIVVPKVAYDLPKFKIGLWYNIAIIHTWSMEHICITRFAKKMSVELWTSYKVWRYTMNIFVISNPTLNICSNSNYKINFDYIYKNT